MRVTCQLFGAIICLCLLNSAHGQNATTTRTSSGGYFVRFGEEQASPVRPNLIPAPAAPTPVASLPAAPIPVPAKSLGVTRTESFQLPRTESMVWNTPQPQPPLPTMPPLPASINPNREQDVRSSSPTPLALSPPIITVVEPTFTEPTPAEPVLAPAELPSAEPTPAEPVLAPAELPSSLSATDATNPTKATNDSTPLPSDGAGFSRQQAISKATIDQPLSSSDSAETAQHSSGQDKPQLTPIRAPETYSVAPLIHGCKDCDVGCDPICCGSTWEHSTTVWAAALYLRPRNADVPFAVPIDGPISSILTNPIQDGAVALLDPDYEIGYTVGFSLALNALTSVSVEYLSLDSSTANEAEISQPRVLRSLVSHPSSLSAAADFGRAEASLGIDLRTLDLNLRHLFVGGDVFAVNYFVGARYGHLAQDFSSTFFETGEEWVDSQVNFDGAGLRLGLETERRACNHCVHFYGRTSASFLAGRFQTSYFQGQTFDPTQVRTSWEAGRIVPILDLEMGGGWSSRCGRFKLSAGYVFSAWFNTVKTNDFIQAVQQNDFNNLNNTLTFDGLVARAEFCF